MNKLMLTLAPSLRKSLDSVTRGCFTISKWAFFLTMLILSSPLCWEILPRQIGNIEVQFTSVLLYISDIPLAITVVTWLTWLLLGKERSLRFGPWYIVGSLITLVVLTVMSVVWARMPAVAAETGIRTSVLFIVYLIAVNEKEFQPLLLGALVSGTVIQAPIAMAQFIKQRPLGLDFLGERPWQLFNVDDWVRGYALSFHPNVLGGFFALGLLCLGGIIIFGLPHDQPLLRRFELILRHSMVADIVLAMGAAGLISTYSRSAWLGLAFGGLVLAFVAFRQMGIRSAIGPVGSVFTIILLVALLLIGSYPNRFVSRISLPFASVMGNEMVKKDIPLAARGELNKVSLYLIENAPWTGVGAGNYAIAYFTRSPMGSAYEFVQPEHNVPLLVTSELGLLGGASWVFLMLSPLFVILRRAYLGVKITPLTCLWTAMILAVLIISYFDFYFWGRQQGRMVLWALLGFWVNSLTQEKQSNSA
jgi:O-antigen ligase